MHLEGLDRLDAAGKRALKDPLKRFFEAATAEARAEMQGRAPVDTGRMKRSIIQRMDKGTPPLWGEAGPRKFWGAFAQEEGARPHWPPANERLTEWAGRHGFPNVFLVQRAISRKGTRGTHFVARAYQAVSGRISSLARELEKDIKRAFDG